MSLLRKKQQSQRRSTILPTASSVYTYRASRSRRDEPSGRRNTATIRATRIRYRVWLQYAPSIAAGFAILASLVYMVGINTNAQIRVLGQADEASLLREETEYQKAAAELFARNITNRNKLTVNTTGIAKDMHKQFPELASVSVTLPLAGRRPIVLVEPVKPALAMTAQNGKFVVDTAGRTVMQYEAFEWPDKHDLPVVTDNSGLSLEPGLAALPKDTVRFITTAIFQLKQKNTGVGELVLPAIAHELHIRLKNQEYYLKMNIAGDARQQAGAYLAVIARLKGEGRSPKEYVDLRVDNRVYYK